MATVASVSSRQSNSSINEEKIKEEDDRKALSQAYVAVDGAFEISSSGEETQNKHALWHSFPTVFNELDII